MTLPTALKSHGLWPTPLPNPFRDDPDDKADPDKVLELTSRTIDAWREVKLLTAEGTATEEPSMEQIDLEVLALTMSADDPERLEKNRRVSR